MGRVRSASSEQGMGGYTPGEGRSPRRKRDHIPQPESWDHWDNAMITDIAVPEDPGKLNTSIMELEDAERGTN